MKNNKIKLDKKNLQVNYKLKKDETCRIDKNKNYISITIMKKPALVIGYSNATQYGDYIVTLDYDDVSKDIVLEDAQFIQKNFKLTPFYLFTTKQKRKNNNTIGNYHLISLSKVDYNTFQDILNVSRCDNKYKTMNRRNPFRSWVIRLSDKGKRHKPEFLNIVGEKNNLNVSISKAHLILLKKAYKLPQINYKNLDGGKIVKFHTYETFV